MQIHKAANEVMTLALNDKAENLARFIQTVPADELRQATYELAVCSSCIFRCLMSEFAPDLTAGQREDPFGPELSQEAVGWWLGFVSELQEPAA